MSEDAFYATMTEALAAVGLIAQQGGPDQLIVSTQHGPVWPNRGNSFWLSCKDGSWFLSTWSPNCYRVPPDQDVVALCTACMESGTSAMYRVPKEIVTRFRLEAIASDDFERLFRGADEGA